MAFYQVQNQSSDDVNILDIISEHGDVDDIISQMTPSTSTKRLNKKLLNRKLSNKVLTQVKITYWQAVILILVDAIPATFGLLFIFINQTINIIFVGHTSTDPEVIAAIGLGTIYINATGYILGMGFLGGVDTLCARSYGAKEYKIMSIYCNISTLVMNIFFLIISIPCIIFSDSFLLAIGQTPTLSALSCDFAKTMIPSLIFGMLYNIYLRYLQAQDIFMPGMIITLITAILHPFWCWIFVVLLDTGLIGAAISLGITQLINYVLILIYMHWEKPNKEEVSFFDYSTFNLFFIFEFSKYALPSAILFAADWIGFDILTIMASYLSEIDLAANICLFNFMTLIFMIPMGISFAVTTFIGNSIGGGNVDIARKFAKVGVALAAIVIAVINALVYIFKHYIPYFYTNDEQIAELSSKLLKIYVIFGIADGVQMIFHGIIKGLGKQKYASWAALIILYPLNIPFAYYLCFYLELGIYGLWYSQVTVVYLLTVTYFLIIWLIHWQDVADLVVKELAYEKEQMEIDDLKIPLLDEMVPAKK